MFSELGSGLSGPASVPLAITALFVSNKIQKVLFGFLALIVGLFSAYRIWLKEYERAEREHTLNTLPEIIPEVRHCFWVDATKYSDSLVNQIFAEIRLTNLRDVDTLIKNYRLTVETEGKTTGGTNDARFRNGKLIYDPGPSIPGSTRVINQETLDIFALALRVAPPLPLTKGIYRDGWIAFNLNLSHVSQYSSPQARVTLEITDSFNGKHQSAPTDLVIHYAEFIRPA